MQDIHQCDYRIRPVQAPSPLLTKEKLGTSPWTPGNPSRIKSLANPKIASLIKIYTSLLPYPPFLHPNRLIPSEKGRMGRAWGNIIFLSIKFSHKEKMTFNHFVCKLWQLDLSTNDRKLKTYILSLSHLNYSLFYLETFSLSTREYFGEISLVSQNQIYKYRNVKQRINLV